MRTPDVQLLLTLCITSLGILLGLFIIAGNSSFFFQPVFFFIPRPATGPALLAGLGVLIIALQALLIDKRTRQFWLEFEFAAFCLLAGTLWLATSATQITQAGTNSDTVNVVFALPADKIESDLVNLHPPDPVTLLLIANHEVQRYNAVLDDVQGVSSEDHNPPYNKDIVKVDVSLPRGINENTAEAFIKQLDSVSAIYILPSNSSPSLTPTSITSNATFVLLNKIESDLSILHDNQKIVILLVVSHQVYMYHALFVHVRDKSGTLLKPPYANEKADNVSVELEQSTEDVIDNFVNQLADATAIYLLPI